MIPKQFNLVNRRWTVRLVDGPTFREITGEKDEPLPKGSCNPARAVILINTDQHSCYEDMLHTFYHELVHAFLFADGDIEHCEKFVDRVGGYLAQYNATQKGDLGDDGLPLRVRA